MPFDLPAATVTTCACVGQTPDLRRVSIPAGAHVQILYTCADQDGWQGEIMTRHKGDDVAIRRQFLRL